MLQLVKGSVGRHTSRGELGDLGVESNRGGWVELVVEGSTSYSGRGVPPSTPCVKIPEPFDYVFP